jgi:hypothetical protein
MVADSTPGAPLLLTPPDDTPTQAGGESPPVPPPPQSSWVVRAAALQAEYVAGGSFPFLSQYLRALPHYIDDTTRDFGDDLYERMLLDGQVSSAIRLLKEETLANGVRLEPAIQRDQMEWLPEEPGLEEYIPARDVLGRFSPTQDPSAKDKSDEDSKKEADLSEKITDFCENCLLHLERPLVECLYEMLDALALGNKIAEQVWEVRRDEDDVPRLFLKALKVKPRKATAFVMDPYMNLVGILGAIPGQAFPVLSGNILSQPGQVPNFLPREKFAIFTWNSQAGDPRGNSILRQVYNPWWLKMQAWGEYAKYLVKFAGPALVGYTAPNAQPVPPQDALGNPIPGVPLITPEQAMLNALLNFAQGQAVVFTNGSRVEPLLMQGDGGAYRNAITLFNMEITKGVLCQTLATEAHTVQARAASETHMDVLDIVILHIKALLASMIGRDILYRLVKYNWGEDVARKHTPKVHLAEVERHNWPTTASAVAALVTSQYLDRSQFPEMDARLGLPKRNPASITAGPVAPTGRGVPMPGGAGGISPPAAGTFPGGPSTSPPRPTGGGFPKVPVGFAEGNGNGYHGWRRNPDYRRPRQRPVIR